MPDQSRDALERFSTIAGACALGGIVLFSAINAALLDTGAGNLTEFLGGAVLGAVIAALTLLGVQGLRRLVRLLPARLAVLFAATAVAAWLLVEWSPAEVLRTVLDPSSWRWPWAAPTGLDAVSVLTLALAIGLVSGLAGLLVTGRFGGLRQRGRQAVIAATALAGTAAIAILVFLYVDGSDPYPTGYSPFDSADESMVVGLGDPSAAGPWEVVSLSYGAGENPRRPEFGADRDLESRSVDATAMLPEWKGIRQRMRERYWGFGLDEAPLNGLVWAPDGAGPFPLVLIVHGNHGMEDYSDPGYAYLGELLASRGYIAVSVDENFINGSWSGDFRGKEMPARAWFLLEHLALWRDWNADPVHRFGGRVDMGNIALVGHSRGGEAVAIAHAFNRLPYYPDDATVAFDYGFSIQSLVAIAQVDQRYHRRVVLDDVNFLALQGSYDSDEPAFHGLRQFNRIRLDGERYRFKAGLYIHGANHGQFNSTWGREDYGPPQAWLLNTAPIIPGEDQRRVAQVYISAFMDATLRDERAWLALFRDPRAAADWLPDHPYVHQFTDSSFRAIATFDDDLDVLTGTAPGSAIEARGFSLWREEELRHRDERLQGTSAVVLGWTVDDNPAYTVTLPPSFWDGKVTRDDVFTLSISASTEELPDAGEDGDEDDAGDEPRGSPRVTIEALRVDGRNQGVDSEDFAALAPPLAVQYLKHDSENEDRYNDTWEPVLQLLEVPLSALDGGEGVGSIKAFRLRFDQTPSGVVILDDLGIRLSAPWQQEE